MPKKIYIDVTQAYVWQGPVAGIIRVMDKLAARFANVDDYQATFVAWNEQNYSFIEVDFLQALVDREKTSQDLKNHSENHSGYGPEETRSFSTRAWGLLKTKKTTKSQEAIEPFIVIVKGSIFFTPHGGVWESEAYIKQILEMKGDGVVIVQILHDLCPVLKPQFCAAGIRRIYKNYMSKTLPITNLVLAISENTASDCRWWLKSLGHSKLPAIIVFREGDELNIKKGSKPSMKLPKKFIICVGTIEARKNHTALYYAYKLAAQKGKELPTLLVIGRRGWLADDVYEIINTDPEVSSRIQFLHGVTDKELTWFYEHAMFSIYPSFYEGWGLPVAESLLRRTPCIASNISSIPEIGGSLVDYVSPYSPEDIMEKIHDLSTSPKVLEDRRRQIAGSYNSTSWDDSFNQILVAIRSIS